MSAKKTDAVTRYEGKRGVRWIARVRVRGYKERQKSFGDEGEGAHLGGRRAQEAPMAQGHHEGARGMEPGRPRARAPGRRQCDGDAQLRGPQARAWMVRRSVWNAAPARFRRDDDPRGDEEAPRGRDAHAIDRQSVCLCHALGVELGHREDLHPIKPPLARSARWQQDEPPGRTRYLVAEEISRLLKAAADDVELHAAIVVSIATGVRQGELLRFTWADIDLLRGRAVVQYSKNRRKRSVALTSSAVEALGGLRLRRMPDPSARVFRAPDGKPLGRYQLIYRWKAIRKAANLKDVHWHDLRHTCASQLAQHGATLLEIGALLGHTSPTMTQRYAHLIEGVRIKGHDKLDAMLTTPGQASTVEQPRDSSGLQFVAIGGYTMSAHVSYSVETTLQPPGNLIGTSQPAPARPAPQRAQNAPQENIQALDKLDALLAA